LSVLGKVSVIEEKHMDVITGIAGSSPAYVYMFIEAMADAAVKNGLPRKDAYEISAQAIIGAAKMVMDTGIHPGVLKDMVTSPGGTTIEAVSVLEEKGLRHAVISAVDACVEKSRNMSK
jgi:pyrroline-5-carboxylate reductase